MLTHRPQHAHSRKPSLQNAVAWLSRSNSSSNVTHHRLGSKTQISEPLLISEPLSRKAPLGAGAVVVRTPQEALSGAKVLLVASTESPKEKQQAPNLPSPPQSPDLPPPPLPPKRVSIPVSRSSPNLSISSSLTPSPAASPIPSVLSLEPLPSPTPTLSPLSDHFIGTTPPTMSPTESTFKALLVNLAPVDTVDLSKLIVSIETSTGTLRTTFETVTSRQSYLADFITSLLSNHQDNDSDTASSYSNRSTTFTDNRVWDSKNGKNVASSMQIFLDRPSAPYTHILAYLRTPAGAPSVLPRAVRVLSSLPNAPQVPDRGRFEALLELRDEAHYLGLDDLHKLCSEEVALVRRGFGLKLNQSHFKDTHADPLFPTPVSAKKGPFYEQADISVSTDKSEPPSTRRVSSDSLASPRPATRPYIPLMAKGHLNRGRQDSKAPPGWI